MAADLYLFETSRQPTLRLYEWERPTLSLGRFSSLPEGDLQGLSVVKRPTGGGPLLHDGDLTYSVVLPDFQGRRVKAVFAEITGWLCQALVSLGYPCEPAALAPSRPADGRACFDTTQRGEILLHGRKWVGSAQRSHKSRLLQHGSLVREPSPVLHHRVFPESPAPLRLSEWGLEAPSSLSLAEAMLAKRTYRLENWSLEEEAEIKGFAVRL